MQLRDRLPSGAHFKFSATPRDQTLIFELEADASTGDFKTSGALFVSDDQIHQSQRHRIERAGHGHSEFAQTKPAAILHRRLEPGGKSDHLKDPWNSSRLMARKRTRSPGRSSAGGFEPASNNRTGVRPMMFQPPGES